MGGTFKQKDRKMQSILQNHHDNLHKMTFWALVSTCFSLQISIIYHNSKKMILVVDRRRIKSVDNERTAMPFTDIYIGGAPAEVLHSRLVCNHYLEVIIILMFSDPYWSAYNKTFFPASILVNKPLDTLLSVSQSSEVPRVRLDPAQVNFAETGLVLR